METAISSGVPTTVSFFVNLYQTRSFWFDKNISELEILHTILFTDPLLMFRRFSKTNG
jgi:hypothetical protein